LIHFASIQAIREASLDELGQVPGISPGVASAIKEYLA
jgi:excinuclease UvrABC nuclease subunit